MNDVALAVITGDRAMTRGKAVESDGPRSGDQPLVRENGVLPSMLGLDRSWGAAGSPSTPGSIIRRSPR